MFCMGGKKEQRNTTKSLKKLPPYNIKMHPHTCRVSFFKIDEFRFFLGLVLCTDSNGYSNLITKEQSKLISRTFCSRRQLFPLCLFTLAAERSHAKVFTKVVMPLIQSSILEQSISKHYCMSRIFFLNAPIIIRNIRDVLIRSKVTAQQYRIYTQLTVMNKSQRYSVVHEIQHTRGNWE